MATGTGDLAIALSHIPNSHIDGIDIAQGMLAVAQVKIEKKHLDDRITLSHGDGESLPYKDASYDAVTVAFGVRNFENLMPGLKEMRRVLRPDGQIAILEFSQPERFPIKQIYHVYFNVILPVIGRLVSKDNAAYTYLPESVDAFPYGQTFLDKLQEAGFRDLHHRPLTFGIATLYTAKK
ncbi:MAG: ubiquinone/menaquinone biosynthesis methyltransferase [Schleiferiaceae bacterium]|nr:ubiquinone/menaquinone biosynthesis methyltransferase [Schleiferiaceae bacterium]